MSDSAPACLGTIPMRVVVYDVAGEIALDYDTRSDTLSLCPGRLEKAEVVEALQEAAFFVMDAPAPPPGGETSESMCSRGTRGSDGSLAIPSPGHPAGGAFPCKTNILRARIYYVPNGCSCDHPGLSAVCPGHDRTSPPLPSVLDTRRRKPASLSRIAMGSPLHTSISRKSKAGRSYRHRRQGGHSGLGARLP